MTDGCSAARMPEGERRRPQVSQRLAVAMMVAGLSGTGYFGATSVSAQREASISRDEASRITASRNRFEDLALQCQRRETDLINQRLHDLENRR